MKRICTCLAAAIWMLCGCAAEQVSLNTADASSIQSTASAVSTPDADDDITLLRDFLLGRRSDTGGKVLDQNGDSHLDARDLTLLLREGNPPEPPNQSGILVAYFSCTAHTKTIAEYAADAIGADLYEITPAIPYTEEDLQYYTDCRADREQSDPLARPALAEDATLDLTGYETILLGYPIWHGQAPRILYTFLENYDFSGKTIIPFCTSGSSPLGSSAEKLQDCTSAQTTWLAGRRFAGDASKEDVADWLTTLDLSKQEAVKMYLTIGDTKLLATLAENPSADALRALLAESPRTIAMHDYSHFEKVGDLGTTLPRTDERITTQAGDLILYLGNQFSIYYDTNTWDFTRLGHVDDISQDTLKAILGEGDVTVTLSLE